MKNWSRSHSKHISELFGCQAPKQLGILKILLLFAMVLLLSACTFNKQEDFVVEDEPVFLETVENLDIPWSITKKGENFYISERKGTIVMIEGQTDEIMRLPVRLDESLHTEGEGGLLGLELVPNTNLEAYVYHTYINNGQVMNRVVRIEKRTDGWQESEIVIDKIPGAAIHNGGRIKLGPDEKLYITAGDAANPELAQDVNSLAGKILRLNQDGSIPDDNPFPDSPVYSYGHRNPQGLAWDETGKLYATEHGQSAHDEINLIEAGRNYGWPNIEGDKRETGMESPVFHTNGNTWAPSGTAYYNGKLYIATLRGEAVRIFDIENKKAKVLVDGIGRIRDIYIDDQTLYYITNNTDGRGTPATKDDQLLKVKLK